MPGSFDIAGGNWASTAADIAATPVEDTDSEEEEEAEFAGALDQQDN